MSGKDVIDPYLRPDPHPHLPRFTVPPNACDTNAHIFGPHESYPLGRARGATVPPEAPVSQYLGMLDALGVARGVLVQPSAYGTDNTLLLDALKEYPERLRGIAIPDYQTVSDETLADFRAAGVRGVRFNLRGSTASSSGHARPMRIETVLDMGPRLAEHRLHAQILVLINRFADLPLALKQLPVDVVIDHLGYPDPREGLDATGFKGLLGWLETGRCWVKLSSPYRFSHEDVPYPDIHPFAAALVAAAPERVLWATDWPHSGAFPPERASHRTMPNDGTLLDILADWAPDPKIRDRILVDNPARLYGF